jgi:hypothetical protein
MEYSHQLAAGLPGLQVKSWDPLFIVKLLPTCRATAL